MVFASATLATEHSFAGGGCVDPVFLCRSAHGAGRGVGGAGRDRDVGLVVSRSFGRDPRRCRCLRPGSAPALGVAKLPDPWAHAVSAGGAATGAAAVLHRAQLRRPPLRPRRPVADLRAGQRHRRRTRFRDRARYRSGRLRVSGAFGATGRTARRAVPGAGRWTRLHAALRHGADERLRNEFRRAVRQCAARAEQRSPQRWVRP